MRNITTLKFYQLCTSLLLPCLFFTGATFAQTSSGGDFTITQSVITSGSTHTGNSTFSLIGTAGQSLAGKTSSSPPFQIGGGFWVSDFVPTAAGATVSGRVVGVNDKGISGVTVSLLGGNLMEQTVRTDLRGNFKFEDVEVGQFYILSVRQKNYIFMPNNYSFTLLEERTDIMFQRVLD